MEVALPVIVSDGAGPYLLDATGRITLALGAHPALPGLRVAMGEPRPRHRVGLVRPTGEARVWAWRWDAEVDPGAGGGARRAGRRRRRRRRRRLAARANGAIVWRPRRWPDDLNDFRVSFTAVVGRAAWARAPASGCGPRWRTMPGAGGVDEAAGRTAAAGASRRPSGSRVRLGMADAARDGSRLAKEALTVAGMGDAQLVELSVSLASTAPPPATRTARGDGPLHFPGRAPMTRAHAADRRTGIPRRRRGDDAIGMVGGSALPGGVMMRTRTRVGVAVRREEDGRHRHRGVRRRAARRRAGPGCR